MCRLLLSISFGLELALSEPSASSLYDKHDDQIQALARTAGMLHGQGRVAEAYAALDGARQSFHAAKKLMPAEPQAYVTIATALLNSNQLDESIYYWKGAHKRTQDKDVQAWIKGRHRWARYGKVSMRRDNIYAHGQGNLSLALTLMDKQLDLYPGSPSLLLDKATAQVMISEIKGANWSAEAVSTFSASHEASFHAWRMGLFERGRGQLCRSTDMGSGDGSANTLSGALVRDWIDFYNSKKRGALVALDFLRTPSDDSPALYGAGGVFKDRGGFVARFDDVGLSGPNGVIVDETHCNIFLPLAGSIMNLPMNLQLLATWADPPPPGSGKRFDWFDFARGRYPSYGQLAKPRLIPKAASVVQLADTSHFHTLTEVFGRLWLLKKQAVLEDPEVLLVVSKDPRSGKGFLTAALRIFAADVVNSERVVWWGAGPQSNYPDVQLRAKVLFYADWRPPAVLGEDGGHSCTPRSLLLPVRTALLDDFRARAAEQTKPRSCVFILRRKADMRGDFADEGFLRKHLVDIAQAANPPLSFKKFEGSERPAATAELFSDARIVVGVHGGALSNMLFCSHDAVVFEMGFKTPFAGHYRHLAAALGIRSVLLPLAADERGIGANAVKLLNRSDAIRIIRSIVSEPGEDSPVETKTEL